MSEDDFSSGSVRAPSPPSRFRARSSRAWVKVPKPAPLALPARDEEPHAQGLRDVQTLTTSSASAPRQPAPPQAGREHAPSKLGSTRPPDRGLAQGNDLSVPKGGQTKTQRAPLKSELRVPRAAARPQDACGPVASTSKLPVQAKPPASPPSTVNRYKTPARRRLGPVPGGAWAIATLSKLAAEREDQRSAGEDDDLANEEDADEGDLDQLPASIQTAYATLMSRTASKILRRSASKKSLSSKKNKTPTGGRALRVARLSDDDEGPARSTRRTKATRKAAYDASRSLSPPPPPPTHRFAGSETVDRLSSKAKTRYLRRTATGQRRQLSLDPPSQDDAGTGGYEDDSQDESSDDLYAPGPARAPARGRGKKRRQEPDDTPDPSNVKRLKVGAPARGAFLRHVEKTAFSPLLVAKTPEAAPSRLRSISVLEKSIDRTKLKSKSAAARKKDTGPRRMKSLAFCAPEEAHAVGAIAATSPSTEYAWVKFGHAGSEANHPSDPLSRLAKAAVMPEKEFAAAALPRTAKPPGLKKQRMRFIPARLPPPARLVDIVRASRNGTKAATDAENAPDWLEKADLLVKSAKKARRKPTFRFATGPGAKRAPTVMYDAPTASKRRADDSPRPFPPESPIRSGASADLKEGKTDPSTTPSAALGRRVVYPDARSRTTTPGRLLRRLSVIPPRGLAPDMIVEKADHAVGTYDQATAQGHRMVAVESGQLPHGPEASHLAQYANQAQTGHQELASASSASSSDEGLSSSAPPNPSSNGIRLWLGNMDEEETQHSPRGGGGQRSRTNSSDSSGIWSHLPTQFDHRFDEVIQEPSAPPALEPSGGPPLRYLETVAEQGDADEDFRRLPMVEPSVPVSQL